MTGVPSDLPDAVAARAVERNVRIATAESLTCGLVVGTLGRGRDASAWLLGSVVAYDASVKQRVLEVSPGPVVSARCAEEMAAGAARLFGADITVSTTGVGGPDSSEGRAPGTVYLGWWRHGEIGSEEHRFDGGPDAVLESTIEYAQRLLMRLIG